MSAAIAFFARTSSGVFAIFSGLAIGFAVPLIDAALLSATSLRIVFAGTLNWRRYIRLSVAYLYRIKVDNKYLLVKGKRFDQYQPVGGVYKTHSSFSSKRQKFGILDDNLLTPDTVSEADLRVRLRGRWLYGFVSWFRTGMNRETDCWREFYEELVVTGLLSRSNFGYIKYDKVRTRYSPLRYSDWAQSKELLIHDIVELIPTGDQLAELRSLLNSADARILWADEAQIRQFGAVAGASNQTTRVAQTALWTIDNES
ncbi:hypothetical protein KK090_12115 [Curtobacterium flaccumfaciens pv. poinsettiae]|uniref:SMODS-associated NUDIX domain-containing protein n=1 Tax=Curtobacterium poinsettiae TaxID=159612 RepID=UPI001BE123C9|nr:hypothetical protein [Curtobacterium flaccumfaciens]MBT1620001.1 hypothetical protein [Curtobacterium flaccumfaciens pv. poinsettiae]